jgi:hypothetical protein
MEPIRNLFLQAEFHTVHSSLLRPQSGLLHGYREWNYKNDVNQISN